MDSPRQKLNSDSLTFELHIKNMVCSRCVMVIETALKALGLEVQHVELGRATVSRKGAHPTMKEIEKELKRFNFGLIEDPDAVLSEAIKHALLELLDTAGLEDIVLSDYLAKKLAKSYASLSRTFSKHEGITIEKFFIRLKIEKARELIQNGALSFSEVAYKLGYKNLQHLSRQFKQITGMSMSEFQKLNASARDGLESVWNAED